MVHDGSNINKSIKLIKTYTKLRYLIKTYNKLLIKIVIGSCSRTGLGSREQLLLSLPSIGLPLSKLLDTLKLSNVPRSSRSCCSTGGWYLQKTLQRSSQWGGRCLGVRVLSIMAYLSP